jgi:anti-sigma factor RsiW
VTTGKPFDPERDAPLLSAYVDGELGPDDTARVKNHLAHSPRARQEVARLRELKEITAALALRDAPPEAWETFWRGGYNRAERSLGWLLLTVGAAVLGAFAFYEAVAAILATDQFHWLVKAGIFAGGAGLVLLLISVLRERLFAKKRTRYDEVVR